MSATRLYRTFNNKNPTSVKTLDLPITQELVDMGPCVALVYASRKEDGKLRHYEHKFKTAVRCYSSADGRAIIIAGGNLKVTDWIRG